MILAGLLLCTNPASGDEYQLALEAFRAENYHQAGELWQHCATAGVADCQYGLGVLFDEGYDRPRDFGMAMRWFQRAALNGSRDAQVQLGFIYSIGREKVVQAPVQAYVWFTMATNSGAKNAARYRAIVARQLSSQELDKAHRQLAEFGIQYHLQK